MHSILISLLFAQEETIKSPHIYIYVDLPRFDFPIVFNETELPQPTLPPFPTSAPASLPQPQYSTNDLADIFTVVDPEMLQDNPIETKHTRLHRSHRNGPLDRELRPEKSVRDVLNVRSDRALFYVSSVSQPPIIAPRLTG